MEAVADFKPGVAAQAGELHACTEALLDARQGRGHASAPTPTARTSD